MKLRYNYYTQSIIGFLKNKKIELNEIYAVLGISEEINDVSDFCLSIDDIHRLTLFVKDKTGIEHCGIEISKYIDYEKTGFFGPYALSCPTLKDAVFRIYSVHKEVNNLFAYEIIPPQKPSCFVYHLDAYWEMKYPDTAKEIIEFAIANGVLSSRKLTRKNISPEKIEFKHQKPNDVSLYEEVFGCPVYFGKDSNMALYSEKVMDYKIPTYNPALLQILDDFSATTIQKESISDNFVSDVRNAIIKLYHQNIPKEKEVAEYLNISKSYLQKKLQGDKTTYKKVLIQIQKEIALRYLQSNNASIKETAWMLGYNDVSNFYRAFKKWTGKNPKDYKRN